MSFCQRFIRYLRTLSSNLQASDNSAGPRDPLSHFDVFNLTNFSFKIARFHFLFLSLVSFLICLPIVSALETWVGPFFLDPTRESELKKRKKKRRSDAHFVNPEVINWKYIYAMNSIQKIIHSLQ